uniref:Uncharacterized protein n=1 Tax=Aegilops tauschii TaxID=37682 RepID=M8C835_AEGTA
MPSHDRAMYFSGDACRILIPWHLLLLSLGAAAIFRGDYHMNYTFIWFIAFFESILIKKWTIRSSLLCPYLSIKQCDC